MDDIASGATPELLQDQRQTIDAVVNWRLILLCILFLSVILLSVKTVVSRHESRTLFMKLQKMEKERDLLAAQWSRLKLEQGAMLNQLSVERKARWDLGMTMPKTTEIYMIREPLDEAYVGRNDARNQVSLNANKLQQTGSFVESGKANSVNSVKVSLGQ